MHEKQKVALSSVIAAVVITTFKLVVGIETHSLGILSEAAHSALDFLAAAMTFFAVRVSDRPADDKHPYGHGKIESVAALFETILLAVTCIWIIWEASFRLYAYYYDVSSVDVSATFWSFAVIITTIFIDIGRSTALSRVAKKHKSQALAADALHFSSDVASSLVVLVGLVFVSFGIDWVDAVAGFAVAIIVLIISFRLGKQTIDTLLDVSIPSEEEDWIRNYLLTLPAPINGYHELRTRKVGLTRFIELHLEVEPTLSVEAAHLRGDSVSAEIIHHFPGSVVTIHLDPFDDSASKI